MADDFKFPHEEEEKKVVADAVKGATGDETYEVEVVDDTPEADRGRKPMKEPPADVTDDELEQYSESVKKRIQHFSKGYHEERRAKEAAQRERDEAARIAMNTLQENEKLRGSLGQGQTALVEQAKKAVAAEVDDAKRKLKEAHEAFDTDAIVAAQESLTSAKIRADKLASYRPKVVQGAGQSEKPAVQSESQAAHQEQPVRLDQKTTAWIERNSWFESDPEMRATAMGVHQRLLNDGVDPRSDAYFAQIDSSMRKRYPEAFADAQTSEKPERASSVVAPAARSTFPKKIVLTQSQVSLAKRMGVPLDVYAKQVALIERNQNG